jgi:hypothetical protein
MISQKGEKHEGNYIRGSKKQTKEQRSPKPQWGRFLSGDTGRASVSALYQQ